MTINTEAYEKLGTFYLGREYDLGKKQIKDDLVLYDSKDLVTHGVVLGMTGSGKTGLCIALLEECALDNIPAIVIDPKGDIANLMLTFPDFRREDFRPWINEEDARKKGKTADEFAQGQADLWKKGLGDWGQDGERIRRFRESTDITVFTPGSNAGLPVSILSSLDAPPFEIIDDTELLGERIESTVSSLLSLLGIDADPIRSQEHILLSTIFSNRWMAEESLDLEKLIHDIQSPPFDKIGVIPLESFYPEKKRFELAVLMNNLLAAPGFSAWLTGEPLDMQRMLYTPEGKPRISIFSIAHLSDAERMFFVSLLLNQQLSWMRTQSGTTSLRAVLYMDEIYGYLPPTANPPSKKPMLTMLKQARAFGLGVLLATQNPVDLDYKALSNIGTWFLGRLQTERDKMRVLDGLEGAATTQGSTFNRSRMEETLAGLGSRVFLMNNVHEDAPVAFHVRWVMSYLPGPLTRSQIRKLMQPKRDKQHEITAAKPAGTVTEAEARPAQRSSEKKGSRPLLPSGIEQYFLPVINPQENAELVYLPAILRSAEFYIDDKKTRVTGPGQVTRLARLGSDTEDIDWSRDLEFPSGLRGLQTRPIDSASFAELPGIAMNEKNYREWAKGFVDWIYREGGMEVLKSTALDAHSSPGESENDFRVRLQQLAREERDRNVDELREQYAKKIKRLEDRIESAMDKTEEQEAQASSAKLNTAISIGSSILAAFLGRKRVTTSVRSGSTSASRAWKEQRDVARAREKVEDLKEELAQMEQELEGEIGKVKDSIDPMTEQFEKTRIKPLKKNITLKVCGLAWLPYYRNGDYGIEAAWQ